MLVLKRTTLISFVCVSIISNILKAQDYVPFPTDSAFWKTSAFGSFAETFKTYDLSGDTTFNSKEYHKIYETSEERRWNPEDTIIFYPRAYFGAIREQDKIVYFVKPGFITENVAYNFNLGVGDTVAPAISWCPGYPFTIAEIDTVILEDGSLRKRYDLNNCGNATGWYIEGIGNSYGPIPFYGTSVGPGSYAPDLSCFIDHGIFLYPSILSNCSILTSTEEISGTLSNFTVYPNPFYKECVIDFGKVIHQGELRFIDDQGRIVIDRIISNKQQETISVSQILHPGIYLLTFSTGNEIVSRKIILDR